MDGTDTSKGTRRRNTPPPPSTASASASKTPGTVPTSSFYASKNPPPLPSRPKNVGSSHTKVIQPSTPPPVYDSLEGSSFREPQLVEEAPIIGDHTPALLPADDTTNNSWTQVENSWAGGTQASWGTGADKWNTEVTPWDSSGTWAQAYDTSKGPNIDGRDKYEEEHWWDASIRDQHKRPGPGVLPPCLADLLHNPDHSLLSVSIDTPDIKPIPSSSQERGDAAPSFQPPSVDDLTYSIPHPNAYYCRKHNGWVLLQWKSSSMLPPLAKSFVPDPETPFPDLVRRKRTSSCVGEGEQPFGQVNMTHHFHRYEKAVDALKLDPAFRRPEREISTQKKQERRKITSLNLDTVSLIEVSEDVMDAPEEEEGDLLDLYVCCQCSLYCIVSEVIPGVIPVKYFEEFTRDRWDNPALSGKREESVVSGLETFIRIMENKIWKGEHRDLTISRAAFQRKIGWTPAVRCMFEQLGFIIAETVTPTGVRDTIITAPDTDPDTLGGRQSGRKLLRFWVETSAWLLDYQRRHANALKQYVFAKIWVKSDSAREMYQMGIGAHPDQIQRVPTALSLIEYEPVEHAINTLGMTPMTYSPELLTFAYLAQCRCDPGRTPYYFTRFYSVIQAIQELGDIPSQDLQNLVLEERSRNRYTEDDRDGAIKILGFGKDNLLRVDYEDDIDDNFVVAAWRDCVKRAWRDAKDGAQRLRDANDAFRIVAESRGSVNLRNLWEDSSRNAMDPSRAYTVLEVPPEVDESMLMTVFMMRMEEQPHLGDRMREALSTIAEARDSFRIRKFLETGQDPGDVAPTTRPDLPRGLNQLGNTCYLNSLLQYFYTIRELREAVAPMANISVKSLEDEKYSDDDLKRHRVGGRLVTRREILRSRKFVSQLADLFWQLEYCDAAAVTPTMDLAKLALVTSRDEEDEEAESRGTDSSNDTDATLVEDSQSLGRLVNTDSANTVLGKRPRDDQPLSVSMDVDEDSSPKSPVSDMEKNGYVMVSHPSSPRRSKSPRLDPASSSSSSSKYATPKETVANDPAQQGGEEAPKKPPLPERKAPVRSESVMLFGKQHDVAECMDNCMFQIEIALLNFNGLSGSEEKGSVVKRLFYGKLRQRLTAVPDQRKSRTSIHEKQDIFSHLPVNVADSGIDIYDGLSGYFDDTVEYEGAKARMEVSLVELPPLLQIQLQRVQFNRETLQPYKSQAYVKFVETIYMDRFLDSADPQKKARSKSIQAALNARRERLRLLTEHKHAPFGACLDSTLNFLTKQESIVLPQLDDNLVAQLNNEQETVKVEIEELRDEIVALKQELEGVWKDDTAFPYELTSVFIHRGSSPSFGHYFFYSRHLPDKSDEWFKYNDSSVAEVSKDEVLADTTGSTANPYLLVFARKDSAIVQTVKRFDPMTLEDAEP
ncbi:cysteine proteinase [Gyrodon lividus]|nr:cysteine proteinase [Gyrodon lividus]